ncbi:MAG: carboxymuconolactone decarboxylase [Acidimicrobiales bacterium]|nr:carboxymuconolactone decarboxylase [Acidimicrobiales bacterium]
MWQLHPELGEAAEHFSRVIQEHTILPLRVHEAARMRLADINQCVACQGARPADPDAHGLDEEFYAGISDPSRRSGYAAAEQVAIEFAERWADGPSAFDDAFWERMHAAFTDPEIVDLTASCAKWLGFGRMNSVLGLVPECQMQVPAKLVVGAAT